MPAKLENKIGVITIENNVVAVRTREGGDMGTMSLDDFIHQVNVTDSVYNIKID